jgi:DNA-directed RNA polymerase specialized sigma24 family protein
MQVAAIQDLPLDEVARRARSGDAQAQEHLFSSLRVKFLAIAKRRVRRDDLEDVTQDALRVVHTKYKDHERPYGILGWSMMVLRNVIGNYYQKRERLDRGEPFEEQLHWAAIEADGAPSVDNPSQGQAHRTKLVLRSIEQLGRTDSRCRDLFHRILESLQEGGSPREISQRTMKRLQEDFPDRTRESLYVALHRCRNRLRELLRREVGSKGGAVS